MITGLSFKELADLPVGTHVYIGTPVRYGFRTVGHVYEEGVISYVTPKKQKVDIEMTKPGVNQFRSFRKNDDFLCFLEKTPEMQRDEDHAKKMLELHKLLNELDDEICPVMNGLTSMQDEDLKKLTAETHKLLDSFSEVLGEQKEKEKQ